MATVPNPPGPVNGAIMDTANGTTIGTYNTTTTITTTGSIKLTGRGGHNIFGSIDNSGSVYIRQDAVPKNSVGGLTSNWNNPRATLVNHAGATFEVNDNNASSAPTYNWTLGSITNDGTIIFAGRGDTGGSTWNIRTNNGDLVNNGTWNFTQTGTNANNGSEPKITTANGYHIVNNGTINLTNVEYHVQQDITGAHGVINVGDNATLFLEDGAGNAGRPTGEGVFQGQTINLTSSTANLHFDNGSISAANGGFVGVVRGFGPGNTISTNTNQTIVGTTYDPATGMLVLKSPGGDITIDIGKGYNPADFTTGRTADPSNPYQGIQYTGDVPCFLADTMIRTPSGPVAVQDLRSGDEVVTLVDGIEVVRPLSWVGASIVAGRDLDTWPVRIAKDAIAANVPDKDLLVTGEHCLFINGKLIPARMLVNGRTIVSDATFGTYDVFHVELERHAIIIADGMTTESYLNTGRQSLVGADGVVKGVFGAKTWADAAAPLAVSSQIVEPIFRTIEARAIAQGMADSRMAMEFSHDADVHLVTDKGTVIRPAFSNDNGLSFLVPASVVSVRIVSRTFRPSVAVGPFVDDRRDLGVVVGNITLQTGGEERVLDAHLMTETLEGWHGLEKSPTRWTNGNALVVLGKRQGNGTDLLSVQILGGGPYIVEAEDASPVQLSA
jgi:antigen 43